MRVAELGSYLAGALLLAGVAAAGGGRSAGAESFTLHGRVVDAEGRPVAGATIRRSALGVTRLAGFVVDQPGPDYARSGESGEFELGPLPPGESALEVTAPGFRRLRVAALGVPQAAGEVARLVLERFEASDEVVRVESAEGEPVVGAEVSRSSVPESFEGRRYDITDADGFVLFKAVPVGAARYDVAHAELGRLRQVRAEALAPGRYRIRFVEPSGRGVLSGVVVDPASRSGLAGCELFLARADGESAMHHATSAMDGTFRFERVRRGVYRLEAACEGRPPLGGIEARLASEETPVERWIVPVPAGTEIEGRVLSPDGSPASEALVHFGPDPALVTGPDGSFRIAGLGPGGVRLEAESEGGALRGATTVEIDSGQTLARIAIRLEPTFGVEGRVTWRGEPVEGAVVELRGLERDGGSEVATSDAAGGFRVQAASGGRYLALVHLRASGLVHVEEIELAAGSRVDLVVRAGWCAGRVVDATTGAPIGGAPLRLAPVGHPYLATHSYPERGLALADGSFRLGPLAAGPWRIETAVPDRVAVAATVLVEDGRVATVGDLALDAPRELRVRVRTPSGESPSRVSATLAPADGGAPGWHGVELDASGRGRLFPVPEGEAELVIRTERGFEASASVSVPGPEVELLLPAAGRLVLDLATIEPEVAGVRLDLERSDGDEARACCGAHRRGAKLIVPVRAGQLRWTLVADDGRTWSGETWIPESGEVAVLVGP